MKIYKNFGGNSNVSEYEAGVDYIIVVFKGSMKLYRYSYKSAGEHNVERMKALADAGMGLNSYINRFVKFGYEK